MKYIFFDNWMALLRVLITTIICYFALILILRISGKRTLAKMNAFDFVVTIALGSILGAIVLNKSIPLADGLLAAATLIGLQYCISFISVRNKKFKKFISSTPVLLFYYGEYLWDSMKKERITESEINKSIRAAGYTSVDHIAAVILESTGDISVIKNVNESNHNALDDVEKQHPEKTTFS